MKKITTILSAMLLFLFIFLEPVKAEEVNKDEHLVEQPTAQLIKVSKPMNINEMLLSIVEEEQVSFTKAMEMLGINPAVSSLRTVSFRAATYRTLTSQFTVNSGYKPSMKFRCETSEGGGYAGIVQILNVSMDRVYNGVEKYFGGTVYVKLENANLIYYNVSGDFYDTGTTSFSSGVSIGEGKGASVNFSLTYSSNHYKTVWLENSLRFPY